MLKFAPALLLASLTTVAHAHIGDKVYLVFEIPDDALVDLDFNDRSIEDWQDVVGESSLQAPDFFPDPAVGEGADYDPADMDYQIWLGWNQTGNHLYAAVERLDNIYINDYSGGSINGVWEYDSFEFMIDGDHSGGQYNFQNAEDLTDEEKRLSFNRQAQKYNGIYDDPEGRFVGYPGGGDWVNELPYTDAGGGSVGDSPTLSILEFYVTPFDDLIWNSADDSLPSQLFPGKVIGIQLAMPDFDTAPREYRGYHTLSGQAQTFRFAERFVDARLIGDEPATAVEAVSWARIKSSLKQ